MARSKDWEGRTRTGTVTERARHSGQNRAGKQVKIGSEASGAGIGERRNKKLLLVGSGREYWGFYSGEGPIRFESYNIRNSYNGRLFSALRGLSQANLDLGVFQETNLTGGVYTRGSSDYNVVARDVPIRHHG